MKSNEYFKEEQLFSCTKLASLEMASTGIVVIFVLLRCKVEADCCHTLHYCTLGRVGQFVDTVARDKRLGASVKRRELAGQREPVGCTLLLGWHEPIAFDVLRYSKQLRR